MFKSGRPSERGQRMRRPPSPQRWEYLFSPVSPFYIICGSTFHSTPQSVPVLGSTDLSLSLSLSLSHTQVSTDTNSFTFHLFSSPVSCCFRFPSCGLCDWKKKEIVRIWLPNKRRMSAVSTKRSLIMTRNRSGSQGAGEVNLALIGELGSGKSGDSKEFIHSKESVINRAIFCQHFDVLMSKFVKFLIFLS